VGRLNTERRVSTERRALVVFVLAVAVGGVTWLVLGRHFWFIGGEWAVLATRKLSFSDLMRSHLGHFIALPTIEYRALFSVFGLRTYLPYQLITISLHLTAAVLLRVIMRRGGVGPWIATAAATLFVFFGAGAQDILWAFQSTLTGALVLGLVQLLCADHDGGIEARDWWGLLAGLGALMCSGVSLSVIFTVGVVVFLRRGWRAACFHTLPLAAIYVAWSRKYNSETKLTIRPWPLVRWSVRGVSSAFHALAQLPIVSWVLLGVLVVGLVLAFRSTERGSRRRRFAIPAGFLAGAAAFSITNGLLRVPSGTAVAGESRYLWVLAALLLPPMAIAAEAIARRGPVMQGAMIAILLVGIPGNMMHVERAFTTHDTYLGGSLFGGRDSYLGATLDDSDYRRLFSAISRSAQAAHVPPNLLPDPSGNQWVTVGWLHRTAAEGRMPSVHGLGARDAADVSLVLSLQQEFIAAPRAACHPITDDMVVVLPRGGQLDTFGWFTVQLVGGGSRVDSDALRYGASFAGYAQTLTAIDGPLTLRLRRVSPISFYCPLPKT
jgi:hypothetical protein